MTTTYTLPRLTCLGWLVDERTWLGYWLLVERRHWFGTETQAWKWYNDQEWAGLENRMIAEAASLQHYKLRQVV